mmetsp:Transcript_22219/g.26387  ORF Transcript_22219/g.26387 Transcript_22219/m.26387 type:complete len:219 (-) Transcript_22219:158-814(-)|eukprot:CAMPEP_0198250492 /NCGR_PEP_ID=MMETSP1447-20131203/1666_1 /TAXON_ID=420782 /ORGANISM="Chaetoceros dichaeta, Strain CCMP1751" /LENGTH=218 /DNA_ID=CAMNT_0043935339 /DNA_START=48 /DNA_END=704 /DNA_ORIENTATION=+
MKTASFLLLATTLPQCAVAFAPPRSIPSPSSSFTTAIEETSYTSFTLPTSASPPSSTALNLGDDNDENFLRWNRQKRQATVGDRKVELKRPLGIVLEEDENGNVYVDAVAPRGNAARTGQVKKGDIVTMCSATFGDQMWNCRGVGLTRVLAAIRVRAGPNVSLVFESTDEKADQWKTTAKAMEKAEEARARAQLKKDELLDELENDEKKLKRGFFGLF